jgi:hypothetical protein
MAKQQDAPNYDEFVDEVTAIIAAGEADGREMSGLKQMRTALRRTGKHVEEAEQRGYARALAEQQSKGVFAAKGIPDTAAGLFSGVDLTDTAAIDQKLQELASQGIRFEKAAATEGAPPAAAGTPPTQGTPPAQESPFAGLDMAEVGRRLQNVTMEPGMTPEAAIAAAIGQMQATQAGGGPPASSGDVVADIQKMAANPGAYSDEQRLALADRFNRDLDALSQQASGTALLG